jgi:flagellin
MSLSLINNIASLNAQDNLNRTSNALSTSLQRLSSGLKINRGADGPAALVTSQEQQAQISGLQTAISNTTNAVSVVQTAEGGLNEVNSLLLKIRGLAVNSANAGANDANSLAANQAEISNALATIDSISTSTQFGSKQLLDGTNAASATTNNVKATATASGTIASGTYGVSVTTAGTAASVTGATAANVQAGGETLTINGVQIALAGGTTEANQIIAINNASGSTNVKGVDNGAGKIVLYSTSFGTGHQISATTNAAAGTGTGFDTASVGANVDGTNIVGTINGVAASGVGNTLSGSSGSAAGVSITFAATSAANPYTTDATATNVTVDAHKALVFQIGANAGQTASIAIDRSNSDSLGKGVSATFTSLTAIDVTNPANSAEVLKVVDKAISDVSSLRGRIGAFQTNTLESTANNLQTSLENTTAAESNITDTNFAAETANYSKNQVLLQAGTAILSNANQTNQLVLKLLQ